MNFNFQKFIAWALLLGGLCLISWTLYSSFNIFTAKALAPQIFKIEKEDGLIIEEKIPTTPVDFQKEMEKIIGEQIKEIIPIKTLTSFFNLIAWSIFAGILIFAGSQISGLGIKLMKK